MIKKAGIVFCLLSFSFQAIVFNLLLCGSIISAKMSDEENSGEQRQTTLSQKQFANLQWLNKSEFTFGKYLIDVLSIKTQGNNITIVYKADLKEKNILEKLADHLKQAKTKKNFAFVFRISEPSRIPLNNVKSDVKYTEFLVSLNETCLEKNAPPPKG